MARGLPDDSNIVRAHDVYALHDMAELAARLGSPMTYDRYGNILLLEDFEGGLNAWTLTLSGDNAEIALVPERVYDGKLACYMDSGIGAVPEAQIKKYFPPVSLQRVGLQLAFSVGEDPTQLRWVIYRKDGDDSHQFAITYFHGTGTLYYWTVGYEWLPFATPGVLYAAENNYHHCKLVVDLIADEYLRFYLDNVCYSLAGLKPYVVEDGAGPSLEVSFTVRGTDLVTGDVWVDNVFVTTNEH